jgi:hypothetical protein
MQYEIRSVEPVGEDRDLLVEVAYWHSDSPSALAGKPDFVEHHHFENVPDQQMNAVMNVMGQYLDPDDYPVNPWVEVDGDWQRIYFEMGDPRLKWIPGPTPDELIRHVLDQRAAKVKEQALTGEDFFTPDRLPVKSRIPEHIFNRTLALRMLRGRRGKL